MAIQDPTMTTVPDGSLKFGIDRLHMRGEQLMYSNHVQASLRKVPVDPVTGSATGSAITLVKSDWIPPCLDDLTLKLEGNLLMASDAPSRVASLALE